MALIVGSSPLPLESAGFKRIHADKSQEFYDAPGLATIKDFADYSMRLVLGVGGEKLSLAGAS